MSYLNRKGHLGAVEVWVNPDYIPQFERQGIDPYAYFLAQHERILGERRAGCMATPAMQSALRLIEQLKAQGTSQQVALARAQSEFVRYVLDGGTPEQWCIDRGLAPYTYDPIAEERRQTGGQAAAAAAAARTTARDQGATEEQAEEAADTARRSTLAAGSGGMDWTMILLIVGGVWLLARR